MYNWGVMEICHRRMKWCVQNSRMRMGRGSRCLMNGVVNALVKGFRATGTGSTVVPCCNNAIYEVFVT